MIGPFGVSAKPNSTRHGIYRCMSVLPRQTEQGQAYQDNSSNHSDTCLTLGLILMFMLNERIYLSLIIVYRRLCRTAELGRRKLGQFQLSQIWP